MRKSMILLPLMLAVARLAGAMPRLASPPAEAIYEPAG